MTGFRRLCCAAILLAAGCGEDDPLSIRDLDTLLLGRWSTPDQSIQINFSQDETFSARYGVPGVIASNYSGRVWRSGNIVGFRGIANGTMTFVQFCTFRVVEGEIVTLRLQEIHDGFVEGLLGIEDINSIRAEDMRDAVSRVEAAVLDAEALGELAYLSQ